MKPGQVVMLLATGILLPPPWFAQEQHPSDPVVKYDVLHEERFNGVVDEVNDRTCPITGSMGSHLRIKVDKNTYEVHVGPVKFVKMYKAAFQKGDAVEIVGTKTRFEGVDAILPREIKRSNEVFVFRDKKGKPFW